MVDISLDELLNSVKQFFSIDSNTFSEDICVDTYLLEQKYIDSLFIIHFVIFIENLLNKEISIGDFNLDYIKTVGAIYDNYILE